jgi:hypothetical protein
MFVGTIPIAQLLGKLLRFQASGLAVMELVARHVGWEADSHAV